VDDVVQTFQNLVFRTTLMAAPIITMTFEPHNRSESEKPVIGPGEINNDLEVQDETLVDEKRDCWQPVATVITCLLKVGIHSFLLRFKLVT
jgi:hypothetical protein